MYSFRYSFHISFLFFLLALYLSSFLPILFSSLTWRANGKSIGIDLKEINFVSQIIHRNTCAQQYFGYEFIYSDQNKFGFCCREKFVFHVQVAYFLPHALCSIVYMNMYVCEFVFVFVLCVWIHISYFAIACMRAADAVVACEAAGQCTGLV